MLTSNRSFTRRIVFASAACVLLASACGGSNDSRLGEESRVRFVGGGCTGSTTLAVGASVGLRLESATDEPLPGELGATSEAPSIITARMGLDPQTVELKALAEGGSRIEITSSGEPIDALVFKAAPAGVVKHTAEPRVFLGGALDVVVNDVFGDCGANEECRLLGHTFLEWRAEPADRGVLVLDFEGSATFRAKGEGSVLFLGSEPVRKVDLVTQPVDVLPPTEAASLSATLTTVPFDPAVESEVVALPGSVTRPDAFSIRVDAVLTDGSTVPISWRDVDWRIQGEEIVVETPRLDAGDRFSKVFVTAGTGKVTLVADVAMLTLEQPFELELQ